MCASVGCRECLTAERNVRARGFGGLAVILLVGGRHTSGLARRKNRSQWWEEGGRGRTSRPARVPYLRGNPGGGVCRGVRLPHICRREYGRR